MRVLIDECAPSALGRFLKRHGHECQTAQEAGWAGKQNGELLQLAETKFDALVTLDTNLRYQQNLKQRKIAIVMIRAHSNRLADLSQHFPACAQALEQIKPGEFVQVGTAAS
jgi:predicted nuclease of predicted toxin-antitoxin system